VVSGDAISVGEAIAAMAVHSCNDVAVAVAETLSGTENAFALRMTARAKSFGLLSTNFASASGLPDPHNVSTAHDLLLIGSLVMGLHPVFWPVFGIRQWSWRGIHFENTNGLLGVFPGMDGGKTGYIRESGFCLFASAIRRGRRINAVILGFPTAQSRDARMAELLEEAFSQSS
jgi:D-alanyl-D-alanine carboxypeptidase